MKNKIFLALVLIGVIFISAIALGGGFWYGRKDFSVYKHQGTIDVFPKNSPAYDIPMAEYASILLPLEYGLYEKAERRINYFLKGIGFSLSTRLHYATEEEQAVLFDLMRDAELEPYSFW